MNEAPEMIPEIAPTERRLGEVLIKPYLPN